MIALVDVCLFVFLVIIALTIARLRNLFVAVMLSGIFSLLSAGLFTSMDAMDVAFTEAAVGAGISTVLLLLTLDLTTEVETKPVQARIFPLLVALCTGGAMLYATEDMPRFGDPTAPIHQVPAGSGWTDLYNHFTWVAWSSEMHVDNTVTSVLGSYRGYDTLGETFVVFTAALAVMMLLGGRRRGTEPSTIAAIEEDEE
ncbi:MAG: multicomponent Na+:H+ antiporter subunit B [Myxococcota bacterium]|jgi:multicomponent Na+:H+ antiporter subunit B